MDWDLKDSRGDMLHCSLNDAVFYILVTNYFTIWIFFPFLFFFPWKHLNVIFLGTFLSNLVLNIERLGEEKELHISNCPELCEPRVRPSAPDKDDKEAATSISYVYI